ncbi:MAG: chemotaxis protein CheW [Actinomycetota bacterium]|nr:chemotaxis protein CheW [Actinomycetota bacterium]
MSLDELETVLRERAETLGAADEEPDSEMVELALLRLGGERHAIELDRLVEVRIVDRIARVPGVPTAWAGMIAVRGALFPVLDLARLLGVAETRPAAPAVIVLVWTGGASTGLLVDDVPEVTRVRREDLARASATPDSPSGAVTGVTRGLVSLLDLDAVLSDPRIDPTVPRQGGNS